MSILMGVFGIIALIGVVAAIVEHESNKPLPPPRTDDRNWSINYMTDFKRWSHRGRG